MSNHHLFPRALAAIVSFSIQVACASRGAKDDDTRYMTDSSALANSEGKSIESLLTGRFPGVIVSRADGGGLQIRIRGAATFYGSDEPLFVVDDAPLPQGSNGIVYLNPYDIQNIQVLKNPADIGIYGIRGANGVIKITTKKARKIIPPP